MKRSEAARWAAPAAFLAAVTIAVLLVRAGLEGGGAATTASLPATTAATPTAATTTSARKRRRPRPAGSAAQYYSVQSGDTFGTIASRYGTSVARLEALNPGISSTSLTIGERIRVK